MKSAIVVLSLGLALAAGSAARLWAGDPAPAGAPSPKPLQNGFLKGMVGAWDTEMTDGQVGRHKGRSTWRMLLGDTAVSEDYASSLTLADGKTVPWIAHLVLREGTDGKSVEAWMFDNLSLPPTHFVGTVTETTLDATADTPDGKLRVTCETKDKERVFRLSLGGEPYFTEVYRPAAK